MVSENNRQADETQGLREALELNHIGSWEWDIPNEIVTWSNKTYEILGLPVDGVTPSYAVALDHVHPQDRDRYESAIRECLEETGEYTLRNRILRSDGAVRHVIAHGRLVRNEDLAPVRMYGTLQDVTVDFRETARAREAELRSLSMCRRLENQVRLMVEASPIALVMVDRDSRITTLNTSAEVLFGYRRNELLGSSIDVLVPKESRAQHVHHRRAYLQAPTERLMSRAKELSGRRKDGSLVPLDVSLSPVETDEGLAVLVTIIDLTERRRAETELRESETRFRQMAERIDDLFYVLDMPEGTVSYVSPACETIFHRSSEELSSNGEAWHGFVHKADRKRVLEKQQELLHGLAFDEEYRICRPKGDVRWIRDRAFPVWDKAGNVQRMIGILQDITKHRQLEEELRQAQKMEAIGQLASGVAHDFNNLLMGIVGCTSIAMDALDDAKRARSFLEEVKKSAMGGSTIASQLLAFARKSPVELELCDLHEVVSDTEFMLRRLLAEDIELVVVLGAQQHLVYLDRVQLGQVLLNLVVNARDAMHLGGRLTIETRNVMIDPGTRASATQKLQGLYVALRVRDTGCGMSSETQGRVFEPFFTTKEVGKGTGLGLATVFGIVNRAQGTIDVESEVGVGTTFEVLLPRVLPQKNKVPELETPAPGETILGTILLVEDDGAVRMTTRYYLESAGHTVVEATTGTDALRVCQEYPGTLDILLTDMVLPGLNGADVAARISELRPGIQLVFMSAHPPDWLVDEGRLSEGVTSLLKPFSAEELESVIQDKLLRLKRELL